MTSRVNKAQVHLTLIVILLVAAAVLLFHLVTIIWPVLQLFIIAGLIVMALDEVIRWQLAHGIPRWLAAINLFLMIALLIFVGSCGASTRNSTQRPPGCPGGLCVRA